MSPMKKDVLIGFLCVLIVGAAVLVILNEKENSDVLRFKNQRIAELNEDLRAASEKSSMYKDALSLFSSHHIKSNLVLYDYITTNYRRVPKELAQIVANEAVMASETYGMPLGLLVGIMEVESGFDPTRASNKRARGLMQVMPEWVDKLGYQSEFDFHNVTDGIEAGIRVFMIHLEEEDGDLNDALFAYVNGDGDYGPKVYEAMGRFELHKATMLKEKRNGNTKVHSEVPEHPGRQQSS